MNLDYLNPLRWRKSFLAIILGSFLLIWFSFIDTYSLKTRWDLKQRKSDLKERTEKLNLEAARLQQEVEKLEKDPALLEKIAREEYGMRKPGETVYKIQRESTD
jgi:cell division protein FtsB